MKENSRIRFNPVTKEIEIEGSEAFVRTYFKKLQEMFSESPKDSVVTGKKGKVAITKAAKKKSGRKKLTNIDRVVTLIQGASEGVTTAELKKKTGFSEAQIWNIVNRAAKEGKIRKLKRGVYGAV